MTIAFRCALAAAMLAVAAPGQSQEPAGFAIERAAPAAERDEPETEQFRYSEDVHDRMRLPVTIAGSGPYQFVVDTGSERTVIARELAAQLELEPGPIVQVHSLSGPSPVGTYVVPALGFGARRMEKIEAPGLGRGNIGADGMLGADALRSQRVLFDFAREEISITPAARREERWPADAIVVTARRRNGRLVLVDSRIEGQRVWIIIDTGSQVTVGNPRLRRLLAGRGSRRGLFPIDIQSVTGTSVPAEYGVIASLTIGSVEIRQLPMAFADLHPFRYLGLDDRPALLLGMDALRLFERVSIDFGNRRVRLQLRDTALAASAN